MESMLESKPAKKLLYTTLCGLQTRKKRRGLIIFFNVSMHTKFGLSLKDILLKDKIPLQILYLITIRFRKHYYAFTVHVEKMY